MLRMNHRRSSRSVRIGSNHGFGALSAGLVTVVTIDHKSGQG
jgi:hypothetical protein